MRPSLSLEVHSTLGLPLSASVWQGCELAAQLNLSHIIFETNDARFTCYQNGALKLEDDKPGMWTWEKSGVWWDGREIEWEYHGPRVGVGGGK